MRRETNIEKEIFREAQSEATGPQMLMLRLTGG